MRTVIVYESMYGNTHSVASKIADVAGGFGEVALVPASKAALESLDGADLVIIGGPTHIHGLSRPMTRQGAMSDVAKHPDLVFDPDGEGPGLRDWFEQIGNGNHISAAAFDTRLHGPSAVTGSAAKGISRRLHHHGFHEVAGPQSFFVDKENHLVDGEADRAGVWARSLFDRLGCRPTNAEASAAMESQT
jgi:hypothetical protein